MQLGVPQGPVLCCRKQLHCRKPPGRSCEPAHRPSQQSATVACRRQRQACSLQVQATAEAAKEARPSGLTPFAAVRSEEEFFGALQKGVDSGKLPKELYPAFQDFYNSYKQTVLSSDAPDASPELVAEVMGSIADRTFNQFLDPYTFPSYHTRLLEPYDYYKFGQNYVRTLINFDKSVVGHLDRFQKVQEQLDAGHNVVLLANHQTEADPGVWALLLEKVLPRLATEIIYVAGDRVVADPLCKPFSMGRNLFCVHSRKRMDDVPELKAEKMATNRRTLGAMVKELSKGGKLVWIAPSGGRDRPDPQSGEWLPHRYDPGAVELMRTMMAKSKKRGHLWPMAMYSWEVMPPPAGLEKNLGERRLTGYAGTGISLAEELDVDALLSGIPAEQKQERQQKLTETAWQAAVKEFKLISDAIHNDNVRSTSSMHTQPWKD
ncbi:hypothetical protein ABBQ32_004718 [Trebouxia sp. C0010 RCD-2024]